MNLSLSTTDTLLTLSTPTPTEFNLAVHGVTQFLTSFDIIKATVLCETYMKNSMTSAAPAIRTF